MLREFTASDFLKLRSWVTSPEILLQFSANTFAYPLEYERLSDYMLTHPDRKFYMAHDAELGDYGFGEIIPQDADVPRLGRLLIGDPELRGKGYGRKLVALLLNECQSAYGAPAAELYVVTDNEPAVKCYTAMGFEFVDEGQQIALGTKVKTMKKMRLDFSL